MQSEAVKRITEVERGDERSQAGGNAAVAMGKCFGGPNGADPIAA